MGNAKDIIESGNALLGMEFGSTRIKAVLIDENNAPIATGENSWENQLKDGIWTYSLDEIWAGMQNCYLDLQENVKRKYGVEITNLRAIGFSGMMHGYMVFDDKDRLLTPFRTWRNTITDEASKLLTNEFQFHIPQRWSIAHLYQSILNGEEHVAKIRYLTTLSGYIHWKLSGKKVIGIGEASGIFPINATSKKFDKEMLNQFNKLTEKKIFSWKIEDILPEVLVAGENAGMLTEEGARLLDVSGKLKAGIPMCPPEGDAGTGMVATNSVAVRSGNVSAGTSVFAMVVLENELKKLHEELDIVTTPAGDNVAMVHCNNCTSDLNAWINLFKEFSETFGMEIEPDELYGKLFRKALEGDTDGGGLLAYNYFSGEHLTGLEEGRPLFVRTPESRFNLANFMRVNLFTALGALKLGLDILIKEEKVPIDQIYGHGGLFKTPIVGQKILAAAMDAPVAVMETAGEGGAWGIAVLASYMINHKEEESLTEYLEKRVFFGMKGRVETPNPEDVTGLDKFMERYRAGLEIEKKAVSVMQ